MFIDKVKLTLAAGRGGHGAVAWRREKYIPKGGPTGGNGGPGGSVVLETDDQIPSLDAYRNRRLIRAGNGASGGPNKRQGKNGEELVLKVPCGTLVKDQKSGEILHDLTEPGQRLVLCRGGRGGRGNASFATPTNRAPNKATQGTEGEDCAIELELKLIADIGFVGFPNAGKSTLISKLAKVRVKIAPYPFTTLRPNLGYVEFDDYSRVLIADIPGIIDRAHENRGLGFEFLRHIERTKVLVYLLDASGIDGRSPLDDFRVLRDELVSYDPDLAEKPYLVALNKMDTPESELFVEEFLQSEEVGADRLFQISALTKQGLPDLLEGMRHLAQLDGKRFK